MTVEYFIGFVIFLAAFYGVYYFYKNTRGRKTGADGKIGAPGEDKKLKK